MPLPTVSVVMGVKNAQERILPTIASVLSQEGVDLEMIIVNDGSTDETERVIRTKADKDPRIKLISRENRGLTVSLIEGCLYAQGEFIARHDANDISLPGRFLIQTNALLKNKNASFCSTYVRHVTKEGIEAIVTAQEGIIHGSVMMRRRDYHQVGGYRSEFYFAQDVDLWSRLRERGEHISISDIYYEGLMFPSSISSTKGAEQKKFLSFINKAASARRNGESERPWLTKAEELSARCRKARFKSSQYADGAYFIGSCLQAHNPSLAKEYYKEAVHLNSSHLRARLKLAQLN
jgi:glycosyltransferase involved in cell wall biosynthesis